MTLVVEGLTHRQVGQHLGLDELTIVNNLFRIYEKLGISSRVELVLYPRAADKVRRPDLRRANNEPGARSYHPRTQAKIRGATMVASDSMTKRGVSAPSLPQVIFSLGTAPEYEP